MFPEAVVLDPTGDLLITVPKWSKTEPEIAPANGVATVSEESNGDGGEELTGELHHTATSQGKPLSLCMHIILTLYYTTNRGHRIKRTNN